jgi:hypothetical protein
MTTTPNEEPNPGATQENIAGATAETPAEPQPEAADSPKRKPGRPRKRGADGLTAIERQILAAATDPSERVDWVIYRREGENREGSIVRQLPPDAKGGASVVVDNGKALIRLRVEEEWSCWYRPALCGPRIPQEPLGEATVTVDKAPREPSWVSADSATSEQEAEIQRDREAEVAFDRKPRKRKRKALQEDEREVIRRLDAGELAGSVPHLSPLDWLNLRYLSENFRAAAEGENEPEVRRILAVCRGIADHITPSTRSRSGA